jgi:hypothetical protein
MDREWPTVGGSGDWLSPPILRLNLTVQTGRALAGLEAGTVNIGISETNARVTLEQCRENLVGRVVQGQMKVTHSVVPPALAL